MTYDHSRDVKSLETNTENYCGKSDEIICPIEN